MEADIPQILETAMLALFGASWPFAIAKTARAENVEGKSPVFEFMVVAGYLCGIASHLVSGMGLWVVWVYIADVMLVSTDLVLYFAKRHRRPQSAKAG